MHQFKLSLILSSLVTLASAQSLTDYVDPLIGAEGLGRVVVGPSCPFGMVKPSPDCTHRPNSGWAPMPVQVDGFSQTHVSGTGGGPKYGNVLIQPFCEGLDRISHPALRTDEEIRLGYYATTFDNQIRTQVTTAPRASIYQFSYPKDSAQSLLIDAGWFLGEQQKPDRREAQNFVGSEIELTSPTEVRGYTRIRGGWNDGRAYTVYFCVQFDRPYTTYRTWNAPAAEYKSVLPVAQQEVRLSDALYQADNQRKTGALLRFDASDTPLTVRVGISFLSALKARQNLIEQVGGKSFQTVHQECLDQWQQLLSRIEIDGSDEQKRMFYTGLYHTLLEPVDRTGENPGWSDPGTAYYDDFYAIWDTYRTSSPLITLMDPQREVDICNSLLNICHRDGYMPDARSGNSNGRTQGGSNAEIVLADAFVKGLGQGQLGDADHIDWEDALHCMLRDATLPPGGIQEAEGRGGLTEYLRYGYIPYGIDRAGNRTVEYAFDDYAIAQVAQGLGHHDLYQQYLRQSGYWKNLWRSDYEHAGTRGFIMPRNAEGEWLDEVPFGHSDTEHPTFVYTPVTRESPWYTPWWGTFMYEATSWEYSLSIPHDVPGLIEQCGGEVAFRQRLDTFFDKGFYNVNNEPSFLTPCLYHWLGRPDLTSERVAAIVAKHFNSGGFGLPGNDDSGAMSSWLAFHMMGLYPNAGMDYYLIHTPLLQSATIHLANGKDFIIRAKGERPKAKGNRQKAKGQRSYIKSATLNGQPYPYSAIRHDLLMQGGVLELELADKPAAWGRVMLPEVATKDADGSALAVKGVGLKPDLTPPSLPATLPHSARVTFELHRQYRTFDLRFEQVGGNPDGADSLYLYWSYHRDLRDHTGIYRMSPKARRSAKQLCYIQPTHCEDHVLPDTEAFLFASADVLRQLHEQGECEFGQSRFLLIGQQDGQLLVRDPRQGTEMWLLDNPDFPFITQMTNNPIEINWTIE